MVSHFLLAVQEPRNCSLSWWALQLPVVRFIVGSPSFRHFEQQVRMSEQQTRLI